MPTGKRYVVLRRIRLDDDKKGETTEWKPDPSGKPVHYDGPPERIEQLLENPDNQGPSIAEAPPEPSKAEEKKADDKSGPSSTGKEA